MAREQLGEKAVFYPCPVLLIGCRDRAGKPNVFTVAWCGKLSDDMVAITVNAGNYSYGVLSDQWEFTVNLPTADIVRKVDACGCNSGRSQNKFELVGLTPLDGAKVHAPMVAECPVNLECKTAHVLAVGPYRCFIGRVLAAHVDDSLLDQEGNLDPKKINPVAYLDAVGHYWGKGEILGREGFSRTP